jgi:hypothetical protein
LKETHPKWTPQRGVGSLEPNLGKQIIRVFVFDPHLRFASSSPLSLVLLLVIDSIPIGVAPKVIPRSIEQLSQEKHLSLTPIVVFSF